MRRLLAMLAVTALAVAACATEDDSVLGGNDDESGESGESSDEPIEDVEEPSTTDTTGSEGPEGFTPDPIEWESCGGDEECATLTVPLDYSDPTGDSIELFITRSPATGDRVGALFVNPGGPGGSAAGLVPAAASLLPEEVVEQFDIVGVEPRGVGGSPMLDCGLENEELYSVDASIDSPEDEAELLDVSERYIADCEEQFGDVLPHVGTRDVARDMDAVRAAMGDEQLSYLGFSYGSAIGQVYADLFPDRVRAMVLDGILELGPTGLELAADQAAGFELALERFIEDCDNDSSCAAAPNSRELIDEVLAASEEGDGIPAPDADRPAGPGEVNLGISYPLYSEVLWPQLGDALRSAADGDGSAMVDLADGYLTSGSGGFEVYFAVNCLDFDWPDNPDEILAAAKTTAQGSPTLGEALVNDYIRCGMWPVEPEPLEAVTAPGTPPILVISTTGDPATPYEAGVNVAERLENGVLVTHEGDGHTVVLDGKECIVDIVERYLVDLEPPDDGTTCE